MTSPKALAERALELSEKQTFSHYASECKDSDLAYMVPALATEVLKLLEENKVMREALVWLSPIGKYEKAHEPDRFIVGKVAREALAKADGIRNGGA